MKKSIYPSLSGIILMLGLSMLSTSCVKNFETINTNPNLIDQISPGTLINEILYNVSSNNLTNSYNVNSQLMQVQLTYPEYYGGLQRYEVLETSGNSQWNSAYKWVKNVDEMLNAADQEGAGNYKAIALTLKAWIYSNLTDNFGAVPFSEASKAEDGILQAKYDDQQAIYTQLLNDLELANSLYNHSVAMTYGSELLFNNDSKKWQKFTNSLHLRLLLRTSNVDPAAFQKMTRIIEDQLKYPIVSNQSESVVYQITGIAPNLSPWSRPLDFSNQHAVSEFFINTLNALNDPRRSVYVTPAKSATGEISYKGIPSGYDEASFSYSPSYMNNMQVIAPMIIPILTYSEVCFIKAELGQRGFMEGAESAYKDGIAAAVATWTKEPLAANYFQNDLARYNGTLERIMLHKYLALYFTDYQQWSEYRRTGFPVLPKTKSMLNDGKVPERLMYPGIQKVYNPTNYDAAIAKMGGDKIDYKNWWAKK